MYCTKKITPDLIWVGANDRRLAMFEGVYSVPRGVSYNSFLLTDEKTVLFDTVDKAVRQRFLENVTSALDGRQLDYLVIQHMESDHSSALEDILARYPSVKIVCSAKTLAFIKQFFDLDVETHHVKVIAENDTLNTGRHNLHFIMAPMVHWPEVMVTYDSTDRILFSADAFGAFGALNGALYADEVDFDKDYMDEFRRYYANIVGKYGTQVQSLLQKIKSRPVEMICPLHGFVWRKNLSAIIGKYMLWSCWQPEDNGVMIAYASVYGNTENAAEILACRLRDEGIKTVMFDVSVTPVSEIVAAAFRWSHFVFASVTYNGGIFTSMEDLLNDLVAHNIQNRTAAVIENGSWAAASARLIRGKLEQCKNMKVLEQGVSIKSSLKEPEKAELEALVKALADDFPRLAANAHVTDTASIDPSAMYKISYGLFVVTAKDGEKDNGCITNTVMQITSSPLRISVTVNKVNFTHNMILKTGEFNVSVLAESAPFRIYQQFGFHSGKDTDKFAASTYNERAANGIRYVSEHTNCVISAKVMHAHDYGTHTVFTADVTQAFVLSDEPSVTYQYYCSTIKPKPQPQPPKQEKSLFECKICGYVYEGEILPDDIVCPLCKHGAVDFQVL